MKNKYTLIVIIVILIILGVPITISELYKLNRGYMTPWGAEDTLAYSSAIISAIATFILGGIAIVQNEKANDINDRLLRLEEVYAVPSVCIIADECKFVEFSENSIQIKIIIKNLSNGIIKINQVSSMKLKILSTDTEYSLDFAKQCIKYADLLPNQKKQLDFTVNAHEDNVPLCDRTLIKNLNCHVNTTEDFDIVFGYKNSNDLYREKINIAGYGIVGIGTSLVIGRNEITRSDYNVEAIET